MGRNNKLKLLQSSGELKEHYKMYKVGRVWLFAGIATLAAAAGLTFASVGAASAATTDPAVTATADTAADASSATADTPDATAADATAAEAQPGDVTKTTTEQTTTPIADETGTDGAEPTIDGQAGDPNTKDAIFKDSFFGNSDVSAENSATTGLGDKDTANDSIQQANEDTDRANGEYGTVTTSAGAPATNDAANDGLDMAVTTDANKAATNAPAEDSFNDQGAVSSDSENAQDRGTTLYVNGVNTGISLSVVGSTERGVEIGVPANIAASVSVGVLEVTKKTDVGLVLKNQKTGEEFQITDSELAKQYNEGDLITDKAVFTTNFNGSGMEQLTKLVTDGVVQPISNGAAGIGSGLLDAVKTALTVLNGAAGFVGLNFDDALANYTNGITAAQNKISDMSAFGENLMKDGVSQVSLVDTTYDSTTGIISAFSDDSVASSIGNMVQSYVSGWVRGITNGIQTALGTVADPTTGKTALDVLVDEVRAKWAAFPGANLDVLGVVDGAIKTFGNALASAANGASGIIGDQVTNLTDQVVSGVAGVITDGIQSIIDGGLGVSQVAAVPVQWTDPDLAKSSAGAFVGETFNSTSKLYDKYTTADTTIAYQKVVKTQLNDLLKQTGLDATAQAAAQAVADNPNASQEDVDKAIKSLGATPGFTTGENSVTTTVGQATLTNFVGSFDQKPAAALVASKAVTDTVAELPALTGLTAADFEIDATPVTSTATQKVYNYKLSQSGIDKVLATVNKLDSADADYNAVKLADLSGTITLSDAAVAAETDFSLQPVDENNKALGTAVASTGNPGEAVDASALPAKLVDASGKTWYLPNNLSSYLVPATDGSTVYVLYTDVDPTSTGGETNTGDVSYRVIIQDENGHRLAYSGTTPLTGAPGSPVTFGETTYTHDGKVWSKPGTEISVPDIGGDIVITYINNDQPEENNNNNTGSNSGETTVVVVPGQDGKDGQNVQVIKNPDGSTTLVFPDGTTTTVPASDTGSHENPAGGTFVVNPDGTITFTNPDGSTYTFNPKDNTNKPATDDGSKVTLVVIPGKDGADGTDGKDQVLTVEKTPAGDIVIHFPDGSTQTVKPGDTGVLPGGGTFVVNPDGTITFTTSDGGTFTIDPNKGTTTNNNNTSTTETTKDTDKDGIPDDFENTLGTDPTKVDTDGDGDTDLQEVLNGTDPKDPASNLESLKNENNNNNTTTEPTKPIIIVVPGQDGKDGQNVQVIKNADGSTTLVFPDGTTTTIPAGDNDSHTNPAGGTFVVNPDGTITFTNPDGSTYTFDPTTTNNNTPSTTDGSKVTVVVIPGKDGADGTDGKDQVLTVEKTPAGDIVIHFPDGSTQTVKPGDTGDLPGGGTFVVNPDGTITFTTVDGGTFTIDPNKGTTTPAGNGNTTTTGDVDTDGDGLSDKTEKVLNTDFSKADTDGDGDTDLQEILNGTDPKDPASNLASLKNENNNNTSTTTTKPIVIVVPGQDGKDGQNVQVIKNADGSTTLVFPDGTTTTIPAGDNDSHTNPAGGTFVVNPDGSITFTNPDGSTYTFDPTTTNNNTPSTTDGSKVTVVVIPGKDGADGTDGKDQVLTVEKTPAGDIVIHFPDGSTQTVKPGDTGDLPGGGTFVVNPDGTITFTTSDGGTFTIDPNKGTTTTPGGNNTSTTTKDTDKDGISDGLENVLGTDPTKADTDGDGDTDLQEIMNGTNPQDPKSNLASLKGDNNNNSNVTVIVVPGQSGSSTNTVITVEKPTESGDITIHFPDGSTQTVKPGDKGNIPGGGTFVVNADGTITFTFPDGSTLTVDPNTGKVVDKTPGDNGSTGTPGGNTGNTGTPGGNTGNTGTPSGNTSTPGTSDTTGTTGDNTNTANPGTDTTATSGTDETNDTDGLAGTTEETSDTDSPVLAGNDDSDGNGTTSAANTDSAASTSSTESGDESDKLPQTDEQVSNWSAVGVLGLIVSLLGLLGIRKRKED